MQAEFDCNFKEKVKEIFLDMLENERERLYPLFIEIIEDIGLAKAMEEGEKSSVVSERNILNLLKQ